MVRRIVTVVIVLAACVAAVVLTGASDKDVGKVYYAEFDNAFGLSEGGDLRIGGVTAGQTSTFDLSDDVQSSSEPIKARVEMQITEPGFDSLREDAQCDIRQQSLIGEYFVDCQPGTSDQELPEGSTIPVEQTSSTIPADLLNNVLREPYRERLRLIIAELGTGLAGRPDDLAETIQRAHPGLRETNEVLAILKSQTDVLRNFVEDSDDVIDDLAANRADVVRFVEEAGETAAITATRREALAEQFERLPTFLAELDPTMVRLGQLADAQIPLLADLRRASDELDRFFTELGPFANAALPATESLGDTSITGSRAIRVSRNEIRELKQVAAGAGRLGDPLRQFLQTLDDRGRAYETDRRAEITDPPRFDRESLQNRKNRRLDARGFTAMEAILNYPFWQTLSINAFDGVSHFLRGGLLFDPICSPITMHPEDRETVDRCNSYIGPNQPGVETARGVVGNPEYDAPRPVGSPDPDPTEDGGSASSASVDSRSERTAARDEENGAATAAAKGEEPFDPASRRPSGGLPPEVQGLVDEAERKAEDARKSEGGDSGKSKTRDEQEPRVPESAPVEPDETVPDTGVPQAQGTGADTSEELLNFLLGP